MPADFAALPARLLRRLAAWARGLLALVFTLWLLLALVWALLYGALLPRIDDFRPQLQSWAESALGLPVRIGALQARSEGLIPVLELRDLALLDAQGRAALALERVVLTVSPASLLRLRLEQIYIDRPHLEITRSTSGQWSVAGLPLPSAHTGPSDAPDWLFSQGEIVLRNGTLTYHDQPSGAAPVAFSDVDAVLRNRGWQHRLRLDASPPPAWGRRITVMGEFRQPLLSVHAGAWQRWTGQLYALLPGIDLAYLRPHLPPETLGLDLQQGRGALRAWADVRAGQISGGTLDVLFTDLLAQFQDAPQTLALAQMGARINARHSAKADALESQGLAFTTADGRVWPGGNIALDQHYDSQRQATAGNVRAHDLDLAALAHIAQALPLGQSVQTALQRYQPQGLVHDIALHWDASAPEDSARYSAKGRVSGLSLAAPASGIAPQTMGLTGASVQFDVRPDGGKAQLAIDQGALLLPGVFEDPVVPLQRLSTEVQWDIEIEQQGQGQGQGQGQEQGPEIRVSAKNIRFANADAQGQAQLRWRTSDPARSGSGSRFPGLLDLSGQLQRADGTRVHRYLPLAIEAGVRHYVRDAVRAGRSQQVQFKVRGDLHDFPFASAEQGEFLIAAKVQGATYAYVPPSLQAPGESPWPVLTDLAGDLIFDRYAMRVRNASARILGQPQLQARRIQADIANITHSRVDVQAQAQGPLAHMLDTVAQSPLADLTHQALSQTQGDGAAQLALELQLPISDLAQSRVQGRVTLAGNRVQLAPDIPALTQVQGAVAFSEQGFSLAGLRAQALGGVVTFDGGMRSASAPIVVRAQGQASAQGLRETPSLGLLAEIAEHASGSTDYRLQVGIRQGVPEIQVDTALEGMALALPPPLGKTAEARLPVRFVREIVQTAPLQDRLSVGLGEAASVGQVQYERALDAQGATADVLRGSLALGLAVDARPALPASGVQAHLHLARLDIPAWQALLSSQAPNPSTNPTHAPRASDGLADYLPTQLTLRASEVQLQGRALHDVVAGLSRQDQRWRANVAAQELDGHIQYDSGSAGGEEAKIFARLARLSLAQSSDTALDRFLQEQPRTLPALDISVQDFHLHGHALGRLDIEAINRSGEQGPREWRLRRFDLRNPDASFSASGNWALLAQSTQSAQGRNAQRRTALQFSLDIHNAGALLSRVDMADVLRRGKGQMQGQLAWLGSPLQPDYHSMTGALHMDVQAGQFLQADPGLAKLLGVLSLQSLPRRLSLDFRDVFSDGFAFDFVRGDLQIENGIARTNNLQMKGVSAAVLMEGEADIGQETQNLHVVIIPEINAMTASLVATAINPVIGLSSFVAQALLRGPLAAAATQELRIQGTWDAPQVQRLGAAPKPAVSAPAPTPAAPLPPLTGVTP